MRKHKLLKVFWKDTVASAYWMTHGQAKKGRAANVVSVGYLVRKNKKKVILAGTMDTSSHTGCDYNSVIVIPTGCIIKMEEIK